MAELRRLQCPSVTLILIFKVERICLGRGLGGGLEGEGLGEAADVERGGGG